MSETQVKQKNSRPPIVAVLGHVDHGKTTLLDTIRKATVAAGESGGITQHIGAYQIKIPAKQDPATRDKTSPSAKATVDKQKSQPKADRPLIEKSKNGEEKIITFIDTPGHEAFTKMRSRGSQVADIAVLVVAANDGVKPQTEESIKIIKESGTPMVVVINKVDLPEADIEQAKRQLSQHDVLVEGYGGDVVAVPLSAKSGKGVPELLEVLSLVGEMREIQADPAGELSGVIIEVTKDKHKGIVTTVIVKNGTLKVGDTIYGDRARARVRALFADSGKAVDAATPSMPVQVLGWDDVPPVGATVSLTQAAPPPPAELKNTYSLELPPVETIKKLKIILRADVAGSLEAILASLGEGVEVVSAATGEIHESDVMSAKSTGSFIIGFNVKPRGSVAKLAQLEKVRLKTYRIIYELLDEVREVVQILNQPEALDQVLGECTILAEFKFGADKVAGCKVTSGRIARNDLVKLERGEEEIGRARIKSLRQGKQDAPKMESPGECGLILDKKLDFKVGDRIIAYKVHELLA